LNVIVCVHVVLNTDVDMCQTLDVYLIWSVLVLYSFWWDNWNFLEL